MENTKCINVYNNELMAEVPVNNEKDLELMLAESRAAQKIWAGYSLKKRIKILKKLINYLADNADEIAGTISSDNGKMRIEALAAEVLPALLASKYYLKSSKKILKTRRIPGSTILFFSKKSYIEYQPLGVVGIITPWNYPFSIAYSEVLSALIAGNGVILKTATETLFSGLLLKKAFEYCDLPKGLFAFLNMPGSKAGDALLNVGVDKLFFTGSVAVGKYLMENAGKTLTPVSLELGGNDAMIVLDDANLKRASAGAVWAGIQNAGQSCGGVERIYVDEKVYEQFLAKLKKQVEELRPGNCCSFNSDLGLMTSLKQKNAVEVHIKDALEKGATIFAEGKENDHPNYLKPVILTDVNHDMLVMQKETFGPVIAVMKFKTLDEAITMANDSNLGLTGSVWTNSKKKGREVARLIEAGAITVNDHLMSHGMAETSWGGLKDSGIGRTHGTLGILEMVNEKFIIADNYTFLNKQLWWHPYSKFQYNLLLLATQLNSKRCLSKKIKMMFKGWKR